MSSPHEDEPTAKAKAAEATATATPPMDPSALASDRPRMDPGSGVPAGPRPYRPLIIANPDPDPDEDEDEDEPHPLRSLPALGSENYHFRADGVLIDPHSLQPVNYTPPVRAPPPPREEAMSENPRIAGYAQHYGILCETSALPLNANAFSQARQTTTPLSVRLSSRGHLTAMQRWQR